MRKLALLLALAPTLALAATSTWTADPAHSEVGFTAKHLVISNVRGEFGAYHATLVLDEADVTRSTVQATIDVNSISTRVADRDAHLKSPDFFDAARYPTITFRSTKVAKGAAGDLKVSGDLTLHGVTRPVVLDVSTSPEVKGTYGESRRAFEATTRIDRKDFGLVWSKVVEAGPVVGDQVKIDLDLEFVKDAPKSASR